VVECGMEYDVMMGLGGRGGWARKMTHYLLRIIT
jgi:hypothetical protein